MPQKTDKLIDEFEERYKQKKEKYRDLREKAAEKNKEVKKTAGMKQLESEVTSLKRKKMLDTQDTKKMIEERKLEERKQDSVEDPQKKEKKTKRLFKRRFKPKDKSIGRKEKK